MWISNNFHAVWLSYLGDGTGSNFESHVISGDQNDKTEHHQENSDRLNYFICLLSCDCCSMLRSLWMYGKFFISIFISVHLINTIHLCVASHYNLKGLPNSEEQLPNSRKRNHLNAQLVTNQNPSNHYKHHNHLAYCKEPEYSFLGDLFLFFMPICVLSFWENRVTLLPDY